MISESDQSVFYVGTDAEVGHHAAPLQDRLKVIVAEPDTVLDRAVAGDLAIFFSEHFDRFREACAELKRRDCATLYALDGILEWRNAWENRAEEPACPWTMRPVLSHKVACIGAAQQRVLNAWGNAGKTELVGLPRLDRLHQAVISGSSPAGNSSARNNEADAFRVLVMTAKWPGFTDGQIENARRGLQDLKDWFDSHPKIGERTILPVWRITHGLDQQIGVENSLNDLSGKELHEILGSVDAMITTPSTTMVEGMIVGLPVTLLEYNQCPVYVPAAWHIHCADQIAGVVGELAAPPARKVHWQQTLLSDQLANSGSPAATDRMADLIQLMLQETREKLSTGEPLKFPAAMLPPQVSAEAPMALADVYPQVSEFQNFDTIQLQSELAHARREIDYRQRLLDQANKELGEAHEILYSIEEHPIAGPIIRARQKFLDWMGSRKSAGK